MTISRRAFLTSLAAAPSLGRAATGGMFVTLNASLTGPMPWPDFVRLAAKAGYAGADVNLNAAMKEGVASTRALFSGLKLRPGASSLPVNWTRDEPTFQTGLKQLEDAAKFLAAIDCPRIMTVLPPAGDTPKSEFRKICKDRLTAVGEVLGRSNVRLGLEFLGPLHFRTRSPHEFIWRMPEALEFAKECGPNIGLQLDVWHWHHAGATVADILAAGKSRIVSIHVSDAKREPPEDVKDNVRLMPGEGVIDLTGFFRALQQIGYTDNISPEPLGRMPAGATPEEGARLGLETTLAAMRKAGVA